MWRGISAQKITATSCEAYGYCKPHDRANELECQGQQAAGSGINQDAGDGTVLLFDEKLLPDLAEDLKLRKKYNVGRIMSEEHRAKMKQFWFKSVSKTDQTA